MVIVRFFVAVFLSIALCGGSSSADSRGSPSGSIFSIDSFFQDENGRQVYLKELQGKPVIISMIYTRCNRTCPLTIQRLKLIEKKLKLLGKSPEFLLVTFDSLDDVPETLRNFRAANEWGANWHLWRADEATTRSFGVLLGFSFQRDPTTGHFTHSNRIVLLDKHGAIASKTDGLESPIADLVAEYNQLSID